MREPRHYAKHHVCEVDGCARSSKNTGRYCAMHAMRMHRSGRLDGDIVDVRLKLSDMAPIGVNITGLRVRQRVSLKTMALDAGVHHSMVRAISRGGNCRLDTLQAIAAYFNVEVWQLLKPGSFPVPPDLAERMA